MNTANKHLIWVLGLAANITLAQWNTIVGIACGTAGFIYACLGIYSWFEKRQRKARELTQAEEAAEGRSKMEDRKSRRHHHLWLFWVLVGLMLTWVLIAAGQTNGTTGIPGTDGVEPSLGLAVAANAHSPPREPADWHGYTAWHALAMVVAGWITHANWPRLLLAYRWIQDEGGLGMIVWRLLWNPPTKLK